ncbi:MAG: hypothetical protein GY796_17470 [Chloroflexi bacterium]|nr:hypothetical protein [Chloroflexota bacterium]
MRDWILETELVCTQRCASYFPGRANMMPIVNVNEIIIIKINVTSAAQLAAVPKNPGL